MIDNHSSDLETKIIDAAGRLSAAQCRWLLDLASLDETGSANLAEFVSTAAWLGWTCGVHNLAAKEYLAVGKALKTCPEITREFSRGRLSYFQVKLLVSVATTGTEQTLIHLARNSTIGQLSHVVGTYRSLLQAEADGLARHRGRCLSTWFDSNGFFVLHGRLSPEEGAVVESALRHAMQSIPESAPGEEATEPYGARQADALVQVARESLGGAGTQPATGPAEMVVHVDVESLAGLVGEDCHLESGVALAPSTALRLGCDAALIALVKDRQGNPLSVGRRTRTIPHGLRRALSARDKGCRFPGCHHKRFIDGHHIRHWAHGGDTCLANLVQLCSHHHRLVHEGGYVVSPTADGFEFLRPDGSRIPDFPKCEANHSGELSHGGGIRVQSGSICSEWLGDRLNMQFVIGALVDGDP